MTKRNLSREAHTWYTLLSPQHMDAAFAHLSNAYDIFSRRAKAHTLAGDYAPTGYWGGEMENLLQTYDSARALLMLAEYSGMIEWSAGLQDIPRGLQEGVTSWLEAEYGKFWDELNAACSSCIAFSFSTRNSIRFGHAGYLDGSEDWHEQSEDVGISGCGIYYYEEIAFPIRPIQIPEYAPDTSISCKTGEVVLWTGMWVPATGMSSAALAFARKNVQLMQFAYEVTHEDPDDGSQEFNAMECEWHPVRPTGKTIPFPIGFGPEDEDRADTGGLRCPAGQPCSQTGYWLTPAKTDSRRLFKQGELMPDLGSDYGVTIWQWDEQQ